jgi:nitroreductase
MTEELHIRLRKIADTDFEIFPLLKQRYSPHVFRKDSIDDDMLNRMFEAGRWAPSRDNSQPWRFMYTRSGTTSFEMIVDCLDTAYKRWVHEAPLLILSACKHEKDREGEQYSPLHDLGLCLGNITVQAQYMGLGLHHIAGMDRNRLKELFQIPDNFYIATVIAAGYYGGHLDDLASDFRQIETEERHRLPQSEFVCRDNWAFHQHDS